MAAAEGRVEESQNLRRAFAVGPDNDPIGLHEVRDRATLPQELRVRNDSELVLEIEGIDYLGLLVRHAGIVHVGEP